MDVMKTAKEMANAPTVTKAMLSFYPPKTEPKNIEKPTAPQTRLGSWSTSITDVISDIYNASDSKGLKTKRYEGDMRTLPFQFNPSTIRISAYGGGLTPIYNYATDTDSEADQEKKNKKKNGISYGEIETNVSLEFKVIFDAEKNTDAFMIDKLNALSSAGSAIKTIREAVKKEEYSVRPIVEGFLAVMMNLNSRKVVFTWGYMSYSGRLNSVRCNYTMFNPAGEPIRAEVTIRLLATEEAYLEEWKKKYSKELLNYAKQETSNLSNIATNLINLQL